MMTRRRFIAALLPFSLVGFTILHGTNEQDGEIYPGPNVRPG